jgi:hypothetical protein
MRSVKPNVGSVFEAINGMLLDMLAAVARRITIIGDVAKRKAKRNLTDNIRAARTRWHRSHDCSGAILECGAKRYGLQPRNNRKNLETRSLGVVIDWGKGRSQPKTCFCQR